MAAGAAAGVTSVGACAGSGRASAAAAGVTSVGACAGSISVGSAAGAEVGSSGWGSEIRSVGAAWRSSWSGSPGPEGVAWGCSFIAREPTGGGWPLPPPQLSRPMRKSSARHPNRCPAMVNLPVSSPRASVSRRLSMSRATAFSMAAWRLVSSRYLLREGRGDRDAGVVLVDDPRVDVRLLRDRRGVAEVGGDLLDGRLDRALPRRLGVALLGALGQRDRGEHGRVPGAEVLGREVLVRPSARCRRSRPRRRGRPTAPRPGTPAGEPTHPDACA